MSNKKLGKGFQPWDYIFNIELFTNSLMITGQYMIKNGQCVHSVQYGRRCMYAARRLYDAYYKSEENIFYDRWHRMYDKYITVTWDELEDSDLYRMFKKNKHSNPKLLDKFMEKDRKKGAELEKQKQDEAWDYIKRHICEWWD